MKKSFNIKRALRAAALAAAVLFSMNACDIHHGIDAGGDATVTESFSFQVNVASQSQLRLEGVNGPIDLVGVPGATTVEIWGKRRVTSESEEDARAYLRNLEVRVGDSNDEIFVQTVQPQNTHGRSLEVVYHVRMPGNWRAIIKNANGNVLVDSLQNQATVAIANGNVELHEIAGAVKAELTNGNMALTGVRGSVRAELINGNVFVETILPKNGACELKTVSGTLGLQIPKATSAEFDAEVSNGTINLVGLTLQATTSSPKALHGRLGSGEGSIKLNTVNGNIQVAGY